MEQPGEYVYLWEQTKQILQQFGVGKRTVEDLLFQRDEQLPRIGLYDFDEENLCHQVITSTCHIPGCQFKCDTILEFENHYNALHRFNCSLCKKNLPSSHLLDLHIQENHDSFFVVLSQKKPSYCCYLQDCNVKFINCEERMKHCIGVHKFPKDFRFDKSKKKIPKENKDEEMNTDCQQKRKGRSKGNIADIDYAVMVTDLQQSLPS